MTSRTAVSADCVRSPLTVDIKLAAGFDPPPSAGNANNQFAIDPLGGDHETRYGLSDVAMMHKYYAMWDADRSIMAARTGNGLQSAAAIHRQSSGTLPPFPVTEIRRDGSYGYVVPPSSVVQSTVPSPQSIQHQMPYDVMPDTSPPLLVSSTKLSMSSPPEVQQFSRCTSGYMSDFAPYGYVPSDVP